MNVTYKIIVKEGRATVEGIADFEIDEWNGSEEHKKTLWSALLRDLSSKNNASDDVFVHLECDCDDKTLDLMLISAQFKSYIESNSVDFSIFITTQGKGASMEHLQLVESPRRGNDDNDNLSANRASLWQCYRRQPTNRQVEYASYVFGVTAAIGLGLTLGLGGPAGLAVAFGVVLMAASVTSLVAMACDDEYGPAVVEGLRMF